MLNAAICEDEKQILEYIASRLQVSFQKNHFDVSFDRYLNGVDLLSAVSNGKSMIFYFWILKCPESMESMYAESCVPPIPTC